MRSLSPMASCLARSKAGAARRAAAASGRRRWDRIVEISGERRADLSRRRTTIKRFTLGRAIQALEVEIRRTTLVSKALDPRAFQTVGEAYPGSPKV
jgi:hypothetical protein